MIDQGKYSDADKALRLGTVQGCALGQLTGVLCDSDVLIRKNRSTQRRVDVVIRNGVEVRDVLIRKNRKNGST